MEAGDKEKTVAVVKRSSDGLLMPHGGEEMAAGNGGTSQGERNAAIEQPKSSASPLLLYDKEEIEAASDYACKREEKLTELTDKFAKKGKLGLFWDSKVPEKDKCFYYFFTLRSSKKEDVIAEIEKYKQFYQEMSEIVKEIGGDDSDDKGDGKGEGTSQETRDAYTLVLDLRDQLTKLSRAAEAGKKTTRSSAVYDLHWEFVAKHEKLKSLVKRVECVALKQAWQTALATIGRLEADLRRSNDMHQDVCDKFNQLFAKHQEAREDKKALERDNDQLQEQQRQLLEKNDSQAERLETLEQEKSELSQANQKLDDRHKRVCDMLEQLCSKHREAREDRKVLERDNDLLQEQRQQLLACSRDQAEQLETLRRKNEELKQEKGELAEAVKDLKEQQKELSEKNAVILDVLKTIGEQIAKK